MVEFPYCLQVPVVYCPLPAVLEFPGVGADCLLVLVGAGCPLVLGAVGAGCLVLGDVGVGFLLLDQFLEGLEQVYI